MQCLTIATDMISACTWRVSTAADGSQNTNAGVDMDTAYKSQVLDVVYGVILKIDNVRYGC